MSTTFAETTELELRVLPVAMSDEDPGEEDEELDEDDEEEGPDDEDLEDGDEAEEEEMI